MSYKRKKTVLFSISVLFFLIVLISTSLFVFFPELVLALTAGPNTASTASNINCVSCTDWTSPGAVTSSDNSYATVPLATTYESSYIKATNFGFSIPGGATIDGILVEWEVSVTDDLEPSYDIEAKIVKGGTIGSVDRSSGTAYTATDTFLIHGSVSDLWGETWTPADINSSTFGAALRSVTYSASSNVRVDSVRITVTYTAGATVSVSGTAYTNEGVTNIGANKTVAISINGAAAAGTDDTDSSGAYSITGLTISANDILTLYIDGETEKAVTVTKATGSNQTGVDLYQNDLITRCDNSCSLTNANLDTANNNGDTDIDAIYTGTSAITTPSGISLFIPASQTFAPGGDLNIGLNFTNNGTYTSGAETITLADTSSTSKTFTGGNGSYYDLAITGSGTGSVTISGNNSFNNFTIGAPKTVTFTSANTQTISGTFTATGSAGNIITINSSISGTAGILSKASGTVLCDYLLLQDSSATGGAVWFAGAHSIGLTGNTGWTFSGAGGGGGSGSSASFVQKHFKIYKDDASLNLANFYANEDENYNLGIGVNFRIRLQVANIGTGAEDISRRLEFKEDEGAWKQITSDTNSVRLSNSTNFTDGQATLARLTSSGNFVAGQGKDIDSDTSKLSLVNGKYLEDEYSLVFLNSSLGHTYRFRITNLGNQLYSYEVTPIIIPESVDLVLYNFNPAYDSTIKTAKPKITFSLNKVGDCRASLVNGSYDDMSLNTICSVANSTSMSCRMPNLGADGSKKIYFACQDIFGNKDTKETTHSIIYNLSSSDNNLSSLTMKGWMTIVGGLKIK